MSSLAAIALSGMSAAQLRLSAAGHNIANNSTPNFQPEVVDQSSVAGGGVQASLSQSPTASNDLAANLVEEQSAVYAFKANMRTVQAQKDMLGSLFDAFA